MWSDFQTGGVRFASQKSCDVAAMRKCYEKLNYESPYLARDMVRLAERTPPELLKDATGYRLEARARTALDAMKTYADDVRAARQIRGK